VPTTVVVPPLEEVGAVVNNVEVLNVEVVAWVPLTVPTDVSMVVEIEDVVLKVVVAPREVSIVVAVPTDVKLSDVALKVVVAPREVSIVVAVPTDVSTVLSDVALEVVSIVVPVDELTAP
jgi:hypothetical protein